MTSSEERREVADKLRQMADAHEATEASRVAHALGLEDKVYGTVIAFDSADIRNLADLIDPTCRDMGGSVPGVSAFECSRCGALLNVGDGGGLRVAGHYYDDTPNVSISYCPNCGARVVSE